MSGCSRTAVSPTPPTAEPPHAQVDPRGRSTAVGPRRVVAVACSGGVDSLALLRITWQAALALRLDVVALHVHHGLQPQADAWVARLRSLVDRWSAERTDDGATLTLRVERLDGAPARGESVEAWARTARYRALAAMARDAGASLVLLGHHAGDQAETVLLQALRGAGVAGLAAMPARIERDGLTWARPWLGRPRSAIAAWWRGPGARWSADVADDPMNRAPRWARSRLRVAVLPSLAAAFPAYERALARSARRAAEARAVLDEVARDDLARCRVADDAVDPSTPRRDAGGPIAADAVAALTAARRINLLRHWWHAATGRHLPDELAQRWRDGARPLECAGWRIDARRAAWRLRRVSQRPPPAEPCASGEGAAPARPREGGAGLHTTWPAVERIAESADLTAPGPHARAAWDGARIVVRLATPADVAAGRALGVDVLRHARLTPRLGGAQFQRAERTPPRTLKKAFQFADVRGALRNAPLLWHGDDLLWVPALGVDARRAWRGDPAQARVLVWCPPEAGTAVT